MVYVYVSFCTHAHCLNLQNGYTPLHWAALNGHLSVAKLLTANGMVDPDAIDNVSVGKCVQDEKTV